MRMRAVLLAATATALLAGTATIGSLAGADQLPPLSCQSDPNNQCQLPSPPSHLDLDTRFAATISEPDPYGVDANSSSYASPQNPDTDMEYLCGAGSTAVALSYWTDEQHFSNSYQLRTRYTTTTWNNDQGRSYIAYLARGVQPKDANGNVLFTGVVDFSGVYPDASNEHVLDTLNWEASGHQPGADYPYSMTDASMLDKDSVRADIVSDIAGRGKPVVVAVNDYYLPGWHKRNNTAHLVTIVGYDTSQNQYTYIETCGSKGCQTDGTGIRHMSEDDLMNGLENDYGTGALFW